jgi:hypothetical protein
VQRMLGRCMLRLQQYERVIKVVVSQQEISGPVRDMEAIRAERVKSAAGKTLGTLVGEFLGVSLFSGKPKVVPCPTADSSVALPSVTMRIGTSLRKEDYAQADRDLKEMVQLRNTLVHHFIDQHDLMSVARCRRAQEALISAYDRIDQNFLRLLEWAREIEETRQFALEVMQSDAFRDTVI